MDGMNNALLLQQAIADCGFAHSAVLPVSQVVLNRCFRDQCRSNACGNYGQCYMCPPDVGDIDQLMAEVQRYDSAVLYQSISSIEDSFDIEGMLEAGHLHNQCSQRIQAVLASLPQTPWLHLSAGGCRFCERCAKRDGLPCRAPKHALPSLEAYGVDVYHTALNASLRYINGANTVTYFGMVLLKEGTRWQL